MATPAPKLTTMERAIVAMDAEVARTSKRADALMARRNRLWLKAAKAGMTPGEIAGLCAKTRITDQTVRLVLRQNGAGPRPGYAQRSRAGRARNGT